MKKKKPYANIDAVPKDKWNLPILCLRQGRRDKAEELLRPILAKIEDIKVFEVFLLVRKLSIEAGVLTEEKPNELASVSYIGSRS